MVLSPKRTARRRQLLELRIVEAQQFISGASRKPLIRRAFSARNRSMHLRHKDVLAVLASNFSAGPPLGEYMAKALQHVRILADAMNYLDHYYCGDSIVDWVRSSPEGRAYSIVRRLFIEVVEESKGATHLVRAA